MSKTARHHVSPGQANRVGAQLAVNGRVCDVAGVSNLHLHGALVACCEHVPLGTPCQLTLSLDEGVPHRVILTGHVIREEEGCLALKLTNVPASESFTMIRDVLLEAEGSRGVTTTQAKEAPVRVRQVG